MKIRSGLLLVWTTDTGIEYRRRIVPAAKAQQELRDRGGKLFFGTIQVPTRLLTYKRVVAMDMGVRFYSVGGDTCDISAVPADEIEEMLRDINQ